MLLIIYILDIHPNMYMEKASCLTSYTLHVKNYTFCPNKKKT